MAHESLDPRVTRMGLPKGAPDPIEVSPMDQWQTYEVFHQQSRGDQHRHVGIVHAPSPEMALVFAKEQYARRSQCVNIWVVKTADVTASEYTDTDMFEPSFDKSYRESYGYKETRRKVEAFKKAQGITSPGSSTDEDDSLQQTKQKSVKTTRSTGRKPAIIIGKKK